MNNYKYQPNQTKNQLIISYIYNIMNYKYLPNHIDQSICNICKKKFNQIYEDNIQMHLSNTIILNELIRSLKSNVEQIQLENDMIKSSLEFYRNLYYRNIHKLV